MKRRKITAILFAGILIAISLMPMFAYANEPTPVYKTLDELAGKRFAYVNGSVYNQNVRKLIDGTSEGFYPSISECVAAVEDGKTLSKQDWDAPNGTLKYATTGVLGPFSYVGEEEVAFVTDDVTMKILKTMIKRQYMDTSGMLHLTID